MFKRLWFRALTMVALLVMALAFPVYANSVGQEVANYQEFLGQLQNSIDHFETTFTLQTDHYDENLLDIRRAYKELSLRDPAAEFITTLSSEYRYDTKILEVKIAYDYDSDKCSQLYAEAMKKVDAISRDIFKPGMTDYEKIKAAHDYVIAHVKYDEASLTAAEAHEYENLFTTAVLEGKAICGGYSWMFKVLLDRVGIGSQIVIGTLDRGDGTSGGHAWNIVWLKGKPYQVDVTNDDLEGAISSYAYFMINDTLLSKNHTWERGDYPPCEDGSYEYYTQNKLWVADTKTAVNLLVDKMKNQGKKRTESASIVFKVLYPEAFDKKWVESVAIKAAAGSNPKWTNYNYEYVLQGDIRYIRIFRLK